MHAAPKSYHEPPHGVTLLRICYNVLMRTDHRTINLHADTHKALKQAALDRDTSIKALIEEALPLITSEGRRNLTHYMQEAGCNRGNCSTCGSVSLGMLAILFPEEYAKELEALRA